MYTPSAYRETRLEVQHALIETHPLGALVHHGAAGLCADHLPFELVAPTPQAPLGALRAHVARANPLWQEASGQAVMVIFQGPHAYITPDWYEEKQRSGRQVPTFDYAVVHAHGLLRAIDDPAWLLPMLERLTARHEAARPTPWQVGDAPADYIARLMKAIVGIEIPLARLDGKWKLGQKDTLRDQATMARELAAQAMPGPAQALGAMMAGHLAQAKKGYVIKK